MSGHLLRKISILMSANLIIAFLFSDELDDKMNELRQIEKQIDNYQQKVHQAEKKKIKTQKDLHTSREMKTQSDKKVAILKKEEAVIQDSLELANYRVRTNEEKIVELTKLANNEFLRLFYIDKQDTYAARKTDDKFLLSLMISTTANDIKDLSATHRELIQAQEETRHEYLLVRSSLTRETKQSETYKKKIQNLSHQATNLEKEKRSYEQQVTKLKKDAAELEQLVAQLTAKAGKRDNSYEFSGNRIPWPVRGTIIRRFGQESKGNNTSIINNGIDIAVPENTSVKSVEAGEVVFADRYGGQGKLIIIDHKNGFFSVYAYNNQIMVSKGSTVSKGQTIAKSGQTGSASQPSLHFELRKDGRAVNPLNYLE